MPDPDHVGTRPKEATLVDLQGREEPPKSPFWRRLSPSTLLRVLDVRRHWDALRSRLRWAREYLDLFGEAKPFLLASSILFAAAVLLVVLDRQAWALYPALVGFGLSVASLLHGSAPQVGARLREASWHTALAMWALMAMIFAFLGFSSTAVVVLVLFIGGFTAVDVVWGISGRLVNPRREAEAGRGGVRQAAANPLPVLIIFAVVAAWAMAATFLIGFYRLHELHPFGPALLAAHIGLVLGLVPMQMRAVWEGRGSGLSRWTLFRPRQLLQDLLFMAGVAALVGYEVTLATDGGSLQGIPVVAVGVVFASYLGVVLRHNSLFRDNLRPYHPIILPAFGMLLLFAPSVVLLSSLPVTITRLYGAAQAAGLVTGTLYIMMHDSWRERARRLGARVQEAVKKRVPVKDERTIADAHEAATGRGPEEGRGSVTFREARWEE